MKENNNLKAEVVKILPEAKLPKIKEKKHIIKCNNCSAKLLEAIELLEIPQKTRLKVLCYCGGSSFAYNMGGKLFFNPINCCIDTVDNIDGGLIITCKK